MIYCNGYLFQKNGYFENLVSDLKETIQEKIPYQTYVDSFNIIKDIAEGERAGLNVEISDYKIGDTTISTGSHWIDFDFVLKHKQKWFSWCRGFTWIFFVIYNINQVIKLFSNRTVIDGANKISEHSGGGTK